ncbi:MAG TPA: hypothetical protein VJZ48_04190, partial [Bacilli bacterium]|nr:hypothetical protein [Bacilli bacterium]
IQTDLIQVGDVTYFERMTYLVSDAGYTPSGSSVRNVNVNKANYSLVALVSTLSLSALAGFYFLKAKKQ